jgi:hypothetical protein
MSPIIKIPLKINKNSDFNLNFFSILDVSANGNIYIYLSQMTVFAKGTYLRKRFLLKTKEMPVW